MIYKTACTAQWFQLQPTKKNANIFLRLRKGPIQDFRGDYLVTSTNRQLEGSHRRHWWGFAGRSSVDVSLHEVYQSSKSYPNYLVRASRQKQPSLNFRECLVTPAGPLLPHIGSIVHTCVPRYPSAKKEDYLHTTLPHAWVGTEEEAWKLLMECYSAIFKTILRDHYFQKDETSIWDASWSWFSSSPSRIADLTICLPAIGCGYNGYPPAQATAIALDSLQGIHRAIDLEDAPPPTLWVEIRCLEKRVLDVWKEELDQRVPHQFRPLESTLS